MSPTPESLVVRSLDDCAPQFRAAVEAAIAECNAKGYDAVVYESTRSEELQGLYYARGRKLVNGIWTVVNPGAVVTKAKTALFGWHIYGLAVDVISKLRGWEVSDAWRLAVTEIFERHGLDAGLRWPHPDDPHYQWGRCKRTPSGDARRLRAAGGNPAVWKAVGAS